MLSQFFFSFLRKLLDICNTDMDTAFVQWKHLRIWTRVQDIDVDRLKLWVLRFSSVTAPPPEMFG